MLVSNNLPGGIQPTVSPPLTPASQQKFLAAFKALNGKYGQPLAALPTGLEFAQPIFAGKTNFSISFGRPIYVLVPEGITGMHLDPNKANEFYVHIGPSTNVRQDQMYGPFSVGC